MALDPPPHLTMADRIKGYLFAVTVAALYVIAVKTSASPLAFVASGVSAPLSVTIVDTATRSIVASPIPIPSASAGVVVDSSGDRAYILSPHENTMFGQGSLFVVDVPERRLIDTIPLTQGAGDISASPDGRILYITHPDFYTLSVVETATRAVATIALINPRAVAVDPSGEWIYVISLYDIVVIKASDRSIVERFSVPGRPIDLAVTPDGRHLILIDNEDGVMSGSVMVIALSSRALIKRFPIGPRYHHLALDGGGRRAFVSGNGIDVRVVDLSSDNDVQTVRVGAGLGGGLAITPDDRELWVMNPSDRTVSIIDTQTLQVKQAITGLVGAASFGKFIGPPMTPAGTSKIVEYYNPQLQHYFITQYQMEIDNLDRKVHLGWGRTGQVFFSSVAGASAPPVCRYYGLPSAGLDSHFYSASAQECAEVAQKFSSSWQKETDSAFLIDLPELSSGNCRAGTVPVWRLWNGRADSNHRYTTNPTIRAAMLAQNYVAEGYGPMNTAMCSVAPQ